MKNRTAARGAARAAPSARRKLKRQAANLLHELTHIGGWASWAVAGALAVCVTFTGVPTPTEAAAANAMNRGPYVFLLDMDGDGAADYANPTSDKVRGEDLYGSGTFGAARGDHGRHRRHQGTDYVAPAGAVIYAPIGGEVSKIGYAYARNTELRFVEIFNAETQQRARVMYVSPKVAIGDAIAAGQPIGAAQNLAFRYPGITNHVHVEIAGTRGRLNPALVLPPADQAFATTDIPVQLAAAGGQT